ncbi:uracil-DNA glycosylase family protein [Bacillus paranthracis]
MKYPDHLVKQVKERSAPYQLEGFLSGQGPENPKFMLLGEAPGETEIHNGIPFSGRAGKQLMGFFRTYSRYKGKKYILRVLFGVDLISGERKKNEMVLLYKKKYNRTPNQGEIVAHAPLLDYELEKLNPKLIVTLGNIGLQRLTGKGKKNHRCTRAIIKTAHSKIKGYTKCRIYMVRERISYFSDLPSCFHFL